MREPTPERKLVTARGIIDGIEFVCGGVYLLGVVVGVIRWVLSLLSG